MPDVFLDCRRCAGIVTVWTCGNEFSWSWMDGRTRPWGWCKQCLKSILGASSHFLGSGHGDEFVHSRMPAKVNGFNGHHANDTNDEVIVSIDDISMVHKVRCRKDVRMRMKKERHMCHQQRRVDGDAVKGLK